MSTAASILLLLLGLAAAAGMANAIRPARSWWAIAISWATAWVVVELALHLIVLSLLAAAALVALGALDHAVGWVGLVVLAAVELAAIPLVIRSRRTVVAIGSVLAELDVDDDAPRYPRRAIAFPWLMLRPRGVRHVRGVTYASDGEKPLKLDVYLPDGPATGRRPAVIQVHGGAWVLGSRREQGIPLLNHLAANGWVGFNIDYRLAPFATWPAQIVDVKKAIAWVREHAEEHGVDPDFIAITGGSAGGHLSALAALTPNDPQFQPGFEDADTSVAAAVPFYGVYDLVDDDAVHNPVIFSWLLEPMVFKARRRDTPERYAAASPIRRVTPDAPPMLVIHGEHDSLIPVAEAHRFVAHLRETSREIVAYAEMQGGQHAFDVIPSWRTVPVIEAIERFLHAVRTRSGQAPVDGLGALTDEELVGPAEGA